MKICEFLKCYQAMLSFPNTFSYPVQHIISIRFTSPCENHYILSIDNNSIDQHSLVLGQKKAVASMVAFARQPIQQKASEKSCMNRNIVDLIYKNKINNGENQKNGINGYYF